MPVGMWIFTTGFWSMGINTAIVIGSQEWARSIVEYVIIVLVEVKILFNKFWRFAIEVFCQSFNVFLKNDWTNGTATVGTIETVELRKSFVVQLVKILVEMRWLHFSPSLNSCWIALLILFGQFFQLLWGTVFYWFQRFLIFYWLLTFFNFLHFGNWIGAIVSFFKPQLPDKQPTNYNAYANEFL